VHQPDARPAPRRVRAPRPGPGGVERGHRHLPRLRLPAAPQPGPAPVPGRRLAHRALPRGAGKGVPPRRPARRPRPTLAAPRRARVHVGVDPQVDGPYYPGLAPPAGRPSGPQIWQVADLAEGYGSGNIRPSPQHNLLILAGPRDRVAAVTDGLCPRDLQLSPA